MPLFQFGSDLPESYWRDRERASSLGSDIARIVGGGLLGLGERKREDDRLAEERSFRETTRQDRLREWQAEFDFRKLAHTEEMALRRAEALRKAAPSQDEFEYFQLEDGSVEAREAAPRMSLDAIMEQGRKTYATNEDVRREVGPMPGVPVNLPPDLGVDVTGPLPSVFARTATSAGPGRGVPVPREAYTSWLMSQRQRPDDLRAEQEAAEKRRQAADEDEAGAIAASFLTTGKTPSAEDLARLGKSSKHLPVFARAFAQREDRVAKAKEANEKSRRDSIAANTYRSALEDVIRSNPGLSVKMPPLDAAVPSSVYRELWQQASDEAEQKRRDAYNEGIAKMREGRIDDRAVFGMLQQQRNIADRNLRAAMDDARKIRLKAAQANGVPGPDADPAAVEFYAPQIADAERRIADWRKTFEDAEGAMAKTPLGAATRGPTTPGAAPPAPAAPAAALTDDDKAKLHAATVKLQPSFGSKDEAAAVLRQVAKKHGIELDSPAGRLLAEEFLRRVKGR